MRTNNNKANKTTKTDYCYFIIYYPINCHVMICDDDQFSNHYNNISSYDDDDYDNDVVVIIIIIIIIH